MRSQTANGTSAICGLQYEGLQTRVCKGLMSTKTRMQSLIFFPLAIEDNTQTHAHSGCLGSLLN